MGDARRSGLSTPRNAGLAKNSPADGISRRRPAVEALLLPASRSRLAELPERGLAVHDAHPAGAAHEILREEALAEIARGRLEGLGPVTAENVLEGLHLSQADKIGRAHV